MKRKRTPSNKMTNKSIFDYFQVKTPKKTKVELETSVSPISEESPLSDQNIQKNNDSFKTPTKIVKHAEEKENSQESSQGDSQSSKDSQDEYVPTYYLTNFFIIFDTVFEKDIHLFDEKEVELLSCFKKMNENCQRLFIRLFHRKRDWFQASKINYKEIENMELTIDELAKEDFLEVFDNYLNYSNEEIESLLSLLTINDLKVNLSPVLKKGNLKRNEIVKLIIEKPKNSIFKEKVENKTLKKMISKLGKCIRIPLEFKELINRINCLFFLNESQDSTSLLLHDMKIVEFPEYNYKPTSIFKTREQFIEYTKSKKMSQSFSQYCHEKNYEKVFELVDFSIDYISNNPEEKEELNVFLVKFTPQYVYTYLIHHSVEVYEKNKMYERSVEILNFLLSLNYLKHKRGKWWNRLAQDYQHLKKHELAFETCCNCLKDQYLLIEDQLTIEKRIERVAKKIKKIKVPKPEIELKQPKHIYIQGISLTKNLPGKSQYRGKDDTLCTVEDLVIQHYDEKGFDSYHTESSIFVTIFGLLFWDIIYMDIPCVFQTKFQTSPLDFRTIAFYPQRKKEIDERLEEIKKDGKMEELINKTWENYEGKANACINWSRITLEEIILIVKSAGGILISSIMLELAKNFKKTKGMPDLIVFDENEFKFCEVKSQRDHLSDHQRIWIDVLIKSNVTVEICHVVEKLTENQK
eukprot:gene6638-10803_t